MAAAYGRSLGSGTEDGTDNTVVITVTANANVGEKLALAASFFQNTTMTVTDSGLNDWTEVVYRQSGDAFSMGLAWADCATGLTSGVSTITITFGATIEYCSVSAHALTGAATGAPTASGASQADGPTWDTVDTTTTDGSVLFGACVCRDSGSNANTAVRGTERYENFVNLLNLYVETNEFATGSASSDIAGSLAGAPPFQVLMAHYGWAAAAGATQTICPDSDITTTGWTSTPLWSKIGTPADATIITSTAA